MCTALSLPLSAPAAHLFGRTLDVDRPIPVQAAVMPRRFPLRLRRLPALADHAAVIGAAVCLHGYPLFFDAANEHGLCMAALNFPGYAAYHPAQPQLTGLAPFEVIPYTLARCRTAAQARALLARAVVTGDAFSPSVPNTPLHWIVADAQDCFAAESTSSGLALIDDPARTLTNSPPLDYHLSRLADFMSLSPAPPSNRFAPDTPLAPHSLGLGAYGLPGDLSSPSRFVRAAFLARHSALRASSSCHASPHAAPLSPVLEFVHLLEAVAQPMGATRTQDGAFEYTHYLSCYDAQSGLYHYRTYDSACLCAVSLHDHDLDGDALLAAPMAGGAAPLFTRASPFPPQSADGASPIPSP